MTEPTKPIFRLDFTVNLSSIVIAAAALIGAGVWVNNVDNRLDSLASVVVAVGDDSNRLTRIETKVDAMDQRGASNHELLVAAAKRGR